MPPPAAPTLTTTTDRCGTKPMASGTNTAMSPGVRTRMGVGGETGARSWGSMPVTLPGATHPPRLLVDLPVDRPLSGAPVDGSWPTTHVRGRPRPAGAVREDGRVTTQSSSGRTG